MKRQFKYVLCFVIFLTPILVPSDLSARRNIEVSTHRLRYADQSVRLDVYDPGRHNIPVVILIHGAAGIQGDRADRFHGFAMDLAESGMIAINVHYFESPRELWVQTILETITFASNIRNMDPDRIALVGYSLGGSLGLLAASQDRRVAQLVIESGYMPRGFTREDASRLPPTYMTAGTEDSAINTLYQLDEWLADLGIPFTKKINYGHGHSIPMELFQENWRDVVSHLRRSFMRRY